MKNRFYNFLLIIIAVAYVGFGTVSSVVAQSTNETGTAGAVPAPATSANQTPASNPPANNNNSVSGSIKPEYSDLTSSKFRLLICDGPAQLVEYNPATKKMEKGFVNKDFVPCDFRGLMMQIQHLINIAMTLGVLIAIAGMVYAGYLYITGVPGNISKAHDIFPSLAKGFIIMLAAWFIVYQILEWLTGTNGYGVLLGL